MVDFFIDFKIFFDVVVFFVCVLDNFIVGFDFNGEEGVVVNVVGVGVFVLDFVVDGEMVIVGLLLGLSLWIVLM